MAPATTEPSPRRALAGCAYFGVRIVRHVARDMDELARRGFGGVLHTFSENDLAYYRGTMREIVDASHAAGLEVQASPWGLGRTFGGEAESRFVMLRPGSCQVLDDGRRVAAACLNDPAYRAFCREWADAALEAGVDLVFWDEPHWVVPEHVGVDDPGRWGCRCERCRELYREWVGEPMPEGLTEEVLAFREASVVDFLGEQVAHVRSRGGRSTVCLLPLVEGPQGLHDWDAVAALPGLDVLATDPYWQVFEEPAGPFVERFARLAVDVAARHDRLPEVWVPAFRLTRADAPDLADAVAAARAAGVERLWVWGFEACAHMSHLATPDAHLVWTTVCDALVGEQDRSLDRLATEARRPEQAELDLLSTRALAELRAGPTRLKALSTVAMVRLGKTLGNLMVDVAATNEKLRARVRRIVRLATGGPPERPEAALAVAGDDVRAAVERS